MNVTDNQIEAIVGRVVDRLAAQGQPRQESGPPASSAAGDRGCFSDIASACRATRKAFLDYRDVPVGQRKKIIAAIRKICLDHLPELARRAVAETGLGRVDDKIKKNRLAIEKTPGVEDLEPEAFSGDDGLTIQERAPFGVIGSITPCTNPSETIICNGIGMIAGGNAVVFNPHPCAKEISVYTVDLLNRAVISAGGPANLFATIVAPTIESAQELMKHADIRLLVVTGGPAVVAVAMKSGKRVIAAGPGNPPVVVDESADLKKAAAEIVASAGCDNNIICVVEKEIIVTDGAADGLKKALQQAGAIELAGHQARQLEKIVLNGAGCPNKAWVGKDIQVILRQIGMEVAPEMKIAVCETGADHPFAREELLMPVLPFIRVRDIDAAIELAYRLENGCFHTAVIHSRNIDNMHRMAKKMNTTIFVKNGMALAGLGLGGEGYTSFTIASPTGEGLTSARHFTRARRCTLSGYFRIT